MAHQPHDQPREADSLQKVKAICTQLGLVTPQVSDKNDTICLNSGFKAEMTNYCIDYLSMKQTHDGILPIVSSEIIKGIDEETGEEVWQSRKPKKVKGSYHSSLIIRCDGKTVSVTGNPSRYGRPDNLWGFSSIGECVQFYNLIIAQYGLPPFTGERVPVPKLTQQEEGSIYTGAEVLRVDVCRNYITGSMANARRFIMSMNGVRSLNRECEIYGKNQGTAAWYKDMDTNKGSSYTSFKYYIKWLDLIVSERRKPELQASAQRRKVLQYCDENGVVRFELTMKAEFLRQHGLRQLDRCMQHDFTEFLEEYEPHRKTLSTVMNHQKIYDRMLLDGHTKSSAARHQAIAMGYLAGQDVFHQYERRTAYRIRKVLLNYGIDISTKLNVTALQTRIETIELAPAAIPSWYKHAQIAQLSAANEPKAA